MVFKTSELIFKYRAYGFKICSEILLPELINSSFESADITISMGKVELPEKFVLNEGSSYKATKDAIYRFWDEIGKFKIIENLIVVDPINGLNKLILRNFLLGTVFATLLRKRGLYVLHASSVNINGYAVAFSGFKGYGKSTTAMTFYKQGYPIVSDDYITIKSDIRNNPFIYPGFPILRLSSISKEFMGLKFKKTKSKTLLLDKSYVSVQKLFSNSKIPLKKIYILKRSEETKITNLNSQDGFIELIKNTFGIHMFSRLELPNNFFQCEKIFNNVNISLLEISDSLEKINEVVKIVEEDLGENI